MWSRVASWRVPRVLTTTPLTCTRPSRMISSALRRLAMPACARIFWRRSPLGSSFDSGFGVEGDFVMVAGFLTAELLIAVGNFNSYYRLFPRQLDAMIEITTLTWR